MAAPFNVLSESMSVASFGAANTTQGPGSGGGFSTLNILTSDRFKELDRRQSYYDCTQHDSKRYDFEGRVIATGGAAQPLLSAEKASWYVPLKMRRPSSPYRLSRVIVGAFTNMIFGEHRFPDFVCEGDKETQDFITTCVKVGQLPVKMIHARNLGGAVGTVGVSWHFADGRPRFEVHNGKHLYVHEWLDRAQLLPLHATECYLYAQDDWEPVKRRYVRNWYWYRRDWHPDAELFYLPALFDPKQEPQWQVDMERSVKHNDGECHLHWIQNLPNDDVDGLPDYDGLYDSFDTLDIILSVIARGAVLNLDPTLVLKMDLNMVNRLGVKKGSDNALAVGEGGEAKYLELTGTSIQAGIELFNAKRRAALEVAQCIVPDPSEIAAQGVSAVAQKVIYSPMLGKCDVIREQYGTPMQRMLDQMARVARRKVGTTVQVPGDAEGETKDVQLTLNLPKRVERQPAVDDDGNPTGEENVNLVDRTPGEGGDVEAKWGPYFLPTPDDVAKQATAMQTATGQKAFLSQQTAVETMATAMGHEPDEEWERVQKETAAADEKAASMFSDAAVGGKVTHTMDTGNGTVQRSAEMPGAEQEPETTDTTAAKGAALTPSAYESIITVNEARAQIQLPPLPGPDGDLTVSEYKAKRAEDIAIAANADLGKTGTPPDADPPPPPMPPGMGGGKGPPGLPGKGGPPGAPPGAPGKGAPPPKGGGGAPSFPPKK